MVNVDTDPVLFDNNLDIPIGLRRAYHLDDTDDPDIVFGVDEYDDDDSDADSADDDELDPPTYITVVSQTVRTAPDGRQVVDVVLSVEDIPNVIKYDVRTTKQ